MRARTAKVRELVALLKQLEPDEIEAAVLFLSGETRQGRIKIGYAALRAASDEQAASEPSLTIAQVDTALHLLAHVSGAGAARRREALLRELFASASREEQDFLRRLLVGELRQGALGGIMTDALAAAAELPPPLVRRAAMYASNLGALARSVLMEGRAGLERFALQIFSPAAPMLAQTAVSVDEAIAAFPMPCAFDWKVDGARIQVHKKNAEVRIFTRALNEVTAAIPEIAEQVAKLPADICVLDGEAVASDAAGLPHPFQITMRRFGRKLDIEAMRAELPIGALFFDCLQLENRVLIDAPLSDRIGALQSFVPDALRIPRLITSSAAEARAFYESALSAGHEGVVAKRLDSTYEAGNRGAGWLKIKRAHTLDLVVIAAEWGNGRREGKLSNLHLAALETNPSQPHAGQFIMLGKTFKGLTDAMLEWQTEAFLAREISRDRWTVQVRPELVVEIAFSDLQASRRYPGGMALRLARVKRYRKDKTAAEADTMDTVRKLFTLANEHTRR